MQYRKQSADTNHLTAHFQDLSLDLNQQWNQLMKSSSNPKSHVCEIPAAFLPLLIISCDFNVVVW